MARPRVLAGVAWVLVCVALAAHAQPTTTPTCDGTDTTGPRDPAADDCCPVDLLGTPCGDAQMVEGLEGGRRNVLVVLSDDHGYCTNGYMAGRCAQAQPGARCLGRRCSNALWLSCDSVSDCPSVAGCGDVTCEAALGECSCRNGFCEQSAADCGADEILVDGLCSPRMDCGTGGSFVCARGRCVPVDPADPGQGKHCLGRSTTDTCSSDRDCDDTCETLTDGRKLCRHTPKACAVNDDCLDGNPADDAQDYVCTSSAFPLRLNELSCRYRRRENATDQRWEHSLIASSAAGLVTTMHTPTLDRLAAESTVFPRARAGAQSCQPARSAVLIGRGARHRPATLATAGRQCRMDTDDLFDEPVLCTADSACDEFYAPRCDPYHSIAFWLEDGWPVPPSGATVTKDAHTIAIGKVEAQPIVDTFDEADEDSVSPNGKFPCPSDVTCGDQFVLGKIPAAAVAAQQNLVVRIRDLVAPNGGDPAPGEPRLPFFVFYGPDLPHDALNGCGNLPNHGFFTGLYGTDCSGQHPSEWQMAGTTYFDASLGALVDELKRTCVCAPDRASPNPDETPVWSSLWDHTVVVSMADHGTLLPNSKNGEGTENGQRQPMLVRVPGATPRVMGEDQSAAFHDVMPTVIDYTNNFTAGEGDALDRYPINRSLRSTVESASPPLLRPIYYGSHAQDTEPAEDNLRRYLIPRPGLLGVCAVGSRVCIPGELNHCSNPLVPCVAAGAMCVNTRQWCDSDTDCATTAVCQESAECAIPGVPAGTGKCCTAGPFRDFGLKTACYTNADCVPPGACRPPVVKIMRQQNNVHVIELNSNPDEYPVSSGNNDEPLQQDLASTGFVPPVLLTEFLSCLDEYWTLAGGQVWRPSNPSPFTCRPEWRQWPRCDDAGNCPVFP